MPDISSPWRELIILLVGSGATKLLDWLLTYRRQRSDLGLQAAQTEGETVGNLERRVTATVRVIDLYQESSDDFALQIRGLRAENRTLRRRVETLEQENAILREMNSPPILKKVKRDEKGN